MANPPVSTFPQLTTPVIDGQPAQFTWTWKQWLIGVENLPRTYFGTGAPTRTGKNEGDLYFDTTAATYKAYVWRLSAWHPF